MAEHNNANQMTIAFLLPECCNFCKTTVLRKQPSKSELSYFYVFLTFNVSDDQHSDTLNICVQYVHVIWSNI